MPASEPGDGPRPPRLAIRRSEADVREADPDLVADPPRPGALRAVRSMHAVLGTDSRRPVHRHAGARCAAAGWHLPGEAVRVVLLRQHHPDLSRRRADLHDVSLPRPAVRPRLIADDLRALCLRLLPAD